MAVSLNMYSWERICRGWVTVHQDHTFCLNGLVEVPLRCAEERLPSTCKFLWVTLMMSVLSVQHKWILLIWNVSKLKDKTTEHPHENFWYKCALDKRIPSLLLLGYLGAKTTRLKLFIVPEQTVGQMLCKILHWGCVFMHGCNLWVIYWIVLWPFMFSLSHTTGQEVEQVVLWLFLVI